MGDWSRTLSRIASSYPTWPASVAVQLDGVAVGILDVHGRASTAPGDGDVRLPQALRHRLPFRSRKMQAEVVEAAAGRVERLARVHEVDEVVATRRFQEQHAAVREGDPETEHIDVEPLGDAQVPGLEGEMTQSLHAAIIPWRPAPLRQCYDAALPEDDGCRSC